MELILHQAYPVPCAPEKTLTKELQHMIDVRNLEECSAMVHNSKKEADSDKYLTFAPSTNALNMNNIRHQLSTI